MNADEFNRTDELPPAAAEAADPDPQAGEQQVGQPESEATPAAAAADEAGEDAAEQAAGGEEADVDQASADQAAAEQADEDDEKEEDEEQEAAGGGVVQPIEDLSGDEEEGEIETCWYILKVQVNREDSIRDALQRRVKIAGLERYFADVIVPTEDIAEFTKTGKKKIVKRKLYPGYIMVNMAINDDTWFLVRETPGIGDFTGSAGKPTPMDPHDVERILKTEETEEGETAQVKTAIPFKAADRVRVKEGYFQNFEGEVESIDEANGRVTVMINIFGRSTPVELEHWQIEAV